MSKRPRNPTPAAEAPKLPLSFEPDLTTETQDVALPDRYATPLGRLPHTFGMVLFLFVLLEVMRMPTPFAWFTFFFVIILIAAVSQAISFRTRKDTPELPIPASHVGARVRACGRPPSLRRLLPLETHMFEPVIVTQGTKAWTWLVALLVGGVGYYAIRKSLPALAPNSVRAPYYAYGALFAIFPLIAWGLSRVRPIYYRVAPGQLDVLCFRFLSGRADLIQRIDLRTSRVEVALGRGIVRIDPPDGPPTELYLMNVSEPIRFAQAILNAAIATEPTPPLPNDSLLG